MNFRGLVPWGRGEVTRLSLTPIAAGAVQGQSPAKWPAATAPPAGAPDSSAEQQRRAAQVQVDNAIDKDAVSAIDEARKAVKAIADGESDQALAAIERATGKINVLTARKPAAALIPVKSEVAIIDLAPSDPVLLDAMTAGAKSAMSSADYPKARYLLIDQALPLPLIESQKAIKDAQQKRDQDKTAARNLLAAAKQDLNRAESLGYAGATLIAEYRFYTHITKGGFEHGHHAI